jgi:uncharacterized membrane protein YeaQ/YmgE (transglycosylase-associated protein family)
MPDLGLLGWIVVGLIAGSVSGWFAKTRSVEGCLPTMIVGVLGGIGGGWHPSQLGGGPTTGFFGALVLGLHGSVIVRVVLRALEGGNRR